MAPPPAKVELLALSAVGTPSDEASATGELAAIEEWLRSSLAQTLYVPAEEVKPKRDFMDLGLDSILGIEWIRAINQRFGTTFATSVVYQCRNIAAFAAMLASVVSGPAARVELDGSADEPRPVASPEAGASSETAAIEEWLRSSLAQTLYVSAEEVKPTRDFMDLGLDSIIGVEWIRAINQRFGITLSTSVVYEYRNVAAFAAMLASIVAHPAPRASAPAVSEPRFDGSLDDLLRQVQAGELDAAEAEELLDERA
jgi:polyketide synthase PksN